MLLLVCYGKRHSRNQRLRLSFSSTYLSIRLCFSFVRLRDLLNFSFTFLSFFFECLKEVHTSVLLYITRKLDDFVYCVLFNFYAQRATLVEQMKSFNLEQRSSDNGYTDVYRCSEMHIRKVLAPRRDYYSMRLREVKSVNLHFSLSFSSFFPVVSRVFALSHSIIRLITKS